MIYLEATDKSDGVYLRGNSSALAYIVQIRDGILSLAADFCDGITVEDLISSPDSFSAFVSAQDHVLSMKINN